jgi:hydroxymethylpyrimidine pyrophosphatase-like HAD family hydrolase
MGLPWMIRFAFGDNFNDLDMLKAVGQGYVMANGTKEVQKDIGIVTADHNHDGIAVVLEKLFRNGDHSFFCLK